MGFCSSCGSEIKQGTTFCGNCGAKVSDVGQQGMPAQNTYSNNTNGTEKKNNNKLIGMIVVGAVALVCLFLLFKVVGAVSTPGYEKPVKYMLNGLQDGNYKTMMKAYPKFMKEQFDEQVEDYYDGEVDELMEMLTDDMKEEYGKKVKLSYKVTDKEKLDKDEVKDLQESFKWRYDEKVKIKEAYVLELEMKIKGSEGKDEEDVEMTVIKIGSDWYLTQEAFGF